MTAEFGDFANINFERIIKQAEEQASRVNGVQEKIAALVGRSESEDGFIKVAYQATQGITDLEINPRAMRMASSDLADTIKQVIRAATEDLQKQIRDEMSGVFAEGNNPRDIVEDPGKATEQIREVREMLNGAIGDASAQMERLRRQFGI